MNYLLLCSIFIFGFAGSVHAQSGTAHKKSKEIWLRIEYKDSPYPVEYVHNECSVSVRNDDQVVWITAKDFNWKGKQLFQFILLQKNVEGMYHRTDYYKFALAKDSRPLGPFSSTDDTSWYDIFSARCGDAAKKYLPDSVKNTLHGQFGIE